jgi:hypothetical protein
MAWLIRAAGSGNNPCAICKECCRDAQFVKEQNEGTKGRIRRRDGGLTLSINAVERKHCGRSRFALSPWRKHGLIPLVLQRTHQKSD